MSARPPLPAGEDLLVGTTEEISAVGYRQRKAGARLQKFPRPRGFLNMSQQRRKTPKLSMSDTPLEREIKTRLAKKYEAEEVLLYERIDKAIADASKALAIELTGVEDEVARRRQTIRHAKVAVKQIEPRNRLHIFLFKSMTGSWWKLGGNSVAIHRLMVSTYLDRDININVDRDNFAVFRDGVICLQDERRLEKDIAYAGAQIERDESIDFGPFAEYLRAYRLRVPLEEREIRRYRKLDEEIMKNINNNVFAASPDVELNNLIVKALRNGYQLERQLDSNARGFVGHLLLDSIFNMRRAYYDVANSPRKSEKRHQAMQRVDHYVGDAMTMLANYADLNIANKSALAKVSLELAKVREMTEQRISQHERHNELTEKLIEVQTGGGKEDDGI